MKIPEAHRFNEVASNNRSDVLFDLSIHQQKKNINHIRVICSGSVLFALPEQAIRTRYEFIIKRKSLVRLAASAGGGTPNEGLTETPT
ncbi:hypothetical protein [Hoeflea sp.]|uniref:hypothetical protein n=1 Tax=Hoeflea sp. TaxID=1940281 RepID=UPI003A8F2A16